MTREAKSPSSDDVPLRLRPDFDLTKMPSVPTPTLRRIAVILALVVSLTAVIAFDAAAATISRLTGVAYPLFSLGSILLYALLGFVLTQRFGMGPELFLILACTAACDATLGWWISSLIGPGKPASPTSAALISGAAAGIVLGMVSGTVGAWIAFTVTRMRQS